MRPGGLIKYLTLYLIIPAMTLGALAVVSGTYYLNSTIPLKAEKPVMIGKGMSIFDIATTLWENGAIEYPDMFTAVTLATGKNKKLKAGEYNFQPGLTVNAVINKMVKGEVVIHSVTIPEGLTKHQALKIINEDKVLVGDATVKFQEGDLLPETYYFSRGYTKNEMLERMISERRKTIFELWQKRAADLPYTTPQEALVMASIVEKETSLDNERAHVAGVFTNRLNMGMPLQSDPTVAYTVSKQTGEMDRALTRDDLKKPSPYNTYLNKGLPPAPICNPGRESIEATINPMSTKDLYFVASGNGGHLFAQTLDQHNKNVREYKKILSQKN